MIRPSAKGFTLIELMVTVLVFAVLLTVGVPAFREFTLSNRLTGRVNAFVGDLTYARNEAIKRNARVTLCKSADPTALTATCAGSGGWEQGRIMFADVDPVGTIGQRDTGEPILRATQAFEDPSTVRGNANVQDRVTYAGTGDAKGFNGQLIFCDERITDFTADSSKARVIVISQTGRVRTVSGDESSLTTCTP